MPYTMILEDKPEDEKQLLVYLKQYTSNIISLKDAIAGLSSTKNSIQKWNPDLVIISTELKDIDSFDLIKAFSPLDFHVIYTSSNPSLAIKAAQFSATDFLIKPICPLELGKALLKVHQANQQKDFLNEMRRFFVKVKQNKITLHTQEGIVVLKLKDIIRLESEGSYTTIYYQQNQKVVLAKGLKDFETLLPTAQFFRTHQSHIVNLDYVHKFLKEDGGCLLLTNLDKIAVARRRKEALMMRLLNEK